MTGFMRVNDPILTILVSQQETQENNVPAELNYFQAWLVVVQPYHAVPGSRSVRMQFHNLPVALPPPPGTAPHVANHTYASH